MEENTAPQQINELKLQINALHQIVIELKEKQIVAQSNSNERLFDTLLEKAAPVVMSFMKMKAEADGVNLSQEIELEKEEMVVIDKLDTKEKYFKGIMLTVCLAALLSATIFLEKAEGIIPVLSLIIGLLFKSNSLADYFTHAKHKLKVDEE